eukprot:6676331-Alexandrium_andersonii.AAC.1
MEARRRLRAGADRIPRTLLLAIRADAAAHDLPSDEAEPGRWPYSEAAYRAALSAARAKEVKAKISRWKAM